MVQVARRQGKPCYAPTFEPAGCLACFVLMIVYALIIIVLALAALFSRNVRCYIKQLAFRVRQCGRGNKDNCVRL